MDAKLPKEIQKKVFELTLAVYRVTDFFPQNEALRRHIREKANDVFGMCSEYSFSLSGGEDSVMVLAKIESLKGYLNIARSLRYVKPINLSILEREYEYIAGFFTQELGKREDLHTWEEFAKKEKDISPKDKGIVVSDKPKSVINQAPKTPVVRETSGGVNERQERILAYIKEASQAKISDFFTFFADISSKTIQRDLQDLVAKNILKKEGEKRWTIYTLATK